MSRFYYGFSGKIFSGDDIKKALDTLLSGVIKEKRAIRLYQYGEGFLKYITDCCCFIISDNVKPIKIRQIKNRSLLFSKKLRIMFGGFDDEWRIRGKIQLSSIVGIGLPFSQIKRFDWKRNPYYEEKLRKLIAIANQLQLPIIDSGDIEFQEYDFSLAEPIFNSFFKRILDSRNCSTYFYHGLANDYQSLNILLSILTTGGIKCKRLLNYSSSYGYNGTEYVSICKKYKEEEYKDAFSSAFYDFVFDSFCLIISDEVDAVKVSLDDVPKNSLDMKRDLRVSDLFDEWQVYKQVPLSSIIGIGIPMKGLKKFIGKRQKEDFEILRKILLIAIELKLDIVDSSDRRFVEKYERKKKENPSKVYQVHVDIYSGLNYE